MPASIVHLLISRQVRKELTQEPAYSRHGAFHHFVEEVLTDHRRYMELGAVGPDLPYYESMAKALASVVLDRSDKPMGVDQWSYQLHSKDPNLFPLKMMEIIWKESDLQENEWEEDDYAFLAFTCGFLTHMAADQIIHPVVNRVAGPYYKAGENRQKHRECEIYQDAYIFRGSGTGEFREQEFNTWCDLKPGSRTNTTERFRFFLQKAFVEAHAVAPSEDSIENWVDGFLTFLRLLNNNPRYLASLKDLTQPGSAKYREYIELHQAGGTATQTYDHFYQQAVELAGLYVKAAFQVYNEDELHDGIRGRFLRIVRNADLGSPLESIEVDKVREDLGAWDQGA